MALFAIDNLPDWTGLKLSLQGRFGAQLTIVENLAAVSVVGTALGNANLSERVLAEADRLGIGILGIDTSPLRITTLVNPQDAAVLARSLHTLFQLNL
jgi:aspartokinase